MNEHKFFTPLGAFFPHCITPTTTVRPHSLQDEVVQLHDGAAICTAPACNLVVRLTGCTTRGGTSLAISFRRPGEAKGQTAWLILEWTKYENRTRTKLSVCSRYCRSCVLE